MGAGPASCNSTGPWHAIWQTEHHLTRRAQTAGESFYG